MAEFNLFNELLETVYSYMYGDNHYVGKPLQADVTMCVDMRDIPGYVQLRDLAGQETMFRCLEVMKKERADVTEGS
jgi:hypothetical protein